MAWRTTAAEELMALIFGSGGHALVLWIYYTSFLDLDLLLAGAMLLIDELDFPGSVTR